MALAWSSCDPVKYGPAWQCAYVWQRSWNEAVSQAMVTAPHEILSWRVLAAEMDSRGHTTEIDVNRTDLRHTGRDVIAVIRVDSRGNIALAGDSILSIANRWRNDGILVSGLEIDYDCATSQLAGYRDYLKQFQHPQLTLSITALPSWLASADLESLLASVDESVLQVHSVMNAKKGLFDAATAEGWVRDWSDRTAKPFWVAAPTYWSRVSWDAAGRVTAIESEANRFGSDAASQELFIDPREVSGFVRSFRKNMPRHFRGFAWFRLPTQQDKRTWSLKTWQAVMSGQAMPEPRTAVRIKGSNSTARDLYVVNQADIDGQLPREVRVSSSGCEFADGLAPYEAEKTPSEVRFVLRSSDVLRAGEERQVGWVRCEGKQMEGHVAF